MEPSRVSLGDVVIDVGAREIVRAGEPQHLEPQAFDLMVALLERRERVVPKGELLDTVWGDQFVSESALTTRIKEIRRALGDDGRRQDVIRNVRGRGYRFVGALTEPAAARRPAVTGLVGRDLELDQVVEQAAAAPLLTVTGPGGIGKTTLARHAARLIADGRGSELVFVRLGTISSGEDLMPAVRRATRLHDAAADADATIEALALRDVVLVLDNCEHVVDEAAHLVRRLREQDTPMVVIATSRERLGVIGEVSIPLSPLDPDEAARLLEERARAVRPDFRLDEHDTHAVSALLEAVDHLPLGVEMAAGRLSAMSVSDLAELLDERIDLLRSTDRSADRHRTIGSLVGWSIDLLDDESRTVLGDFSVFAGAVTTADVDGVIPDQDALATTADLVDRSMIVADVEGRLGTYRMLTTIRSQVHGLRRPDAPRRHARWFADVATDADAALRTQEEWAAHQRLDRCVAELRAAHRWARADEPAIAARLTAALTSYGHTRLWPEPAEWAVRLLDTIDADDPNLPAVWATIAASNAQRGEYRTARSFATRTVEVGGPGLASALEVMQDCALYEGRLDESYEWSRQLREHGEATDDRLGWSAGLIGMALARTYADRCEDARRLLGSADAEALPPTGRAWVDYAYGEALAGDDPRRAIAHLERSRELAESVGSHFVDGVAGVALSSIRARTGDPGDAIAGFVPVLRGFYESGNRTHSLTALRNLVDVLVRTGDHETAMVVLGAVDTGARRSYGEERERLDAARSVSEDRLGMHAVQAHIERGAALGQVAVLELALEVIGDG